VRRQVAAAGLVFLIAHLAFLPQTLEDVDSINFALGVREFDVANHQPHPPGYPVFIALARGTTALAAAAGLAEPVPRGLALLSAAGGALLVPMLYALFVRLDGRVAFWATMATVCSPLFWFTAVRPLSDTAGLAGALGAQVLLVSVIRGSREPGAGSLAGMSAAARLAAGAIMAGLATGIRSQNAVLTVPLLLAVLVWPDPRLSWRHRLTAAGLAAAAGLAWAVPLVVVSGGLGDYLVALGAQGGEDFRGVVMLWTTPHPRVAVQAIFNTFVWPWGALLPGLVVSALMVAGAIAAARRAPGVLAILAIAFGPYLIFHLLFHETATLRYALPLVPPVVFLALYAMAGLGHVAAPAAAAIVMAVVSLAWTLPAVQAYARAGSPAFHVFDRMLDGGPEGDARARVIGMHAVMRRVEEWRRPVHDRPVLPAAHGREWLALVAHWRAEPESSIDFVADPRRTDLVLFDPHVRQLVSSARWDFPEVPFVAGARPGAADFYVMAPPGWMLDRGWALTAEVGGVTAATRLGPHVQPSIAWVRRRSEPATMLLGGRNLSQDGRAARLTVVAGDCEIDSWHVAPGSFTRRILIPADLLEGHGYVPLAVAAAAPDGAAPPAVALEQFDLQSDGVPMFGLLEGWHEPEYQPATGRAWRWMSEHALLWVRPVGRDVTLTLAGESPLRYFDRAPHVRVLSGGIVIASVHPAGDFDLRVRIPADVLDASGGTVSIETDLWFSPAEREGAADRRHLALRVYEVSVR
jgi:hypothetical protein